MTDQKTEWVDWQNTKVLQKAAVADEMGNFLALKRTEQAVSQLDFGSDNGFHKTILENIIP